jgi:hypothetical protein
MTTRLGDAVIRAALTELPEQLGPVTAKLCGFVTGIKCLASPLGIGPPLPTRTAPPPLKKGRRQSFCSPRRNWQAGWPKMSPPLWRASYWPPKTRETVTTQPPLLR